MAYMSERDWQAIVRDLTAERDALAAEVQRLQAEAAELKAELDRAWEDR